MAVAAAGWTPFRLANGDTGYTEPDPSKPGQYLYHGPDGKIYPTSGPGKQEAPGTASTGNVNDASSGTGAAAASPLQPTYLSQLFPNGLPTATAAQDTTSPSTSSIVDSISQALQPTFKQGQRGLTEALANAGIVGGSTVGAEGALANQQQQQATSAEAPYILQGDQMGQTAALANQSATNAANQFNVSNAINGGMYDSSLQAQQADTLAGYQNQDYLEQLGLQGNVITNGQTGQTSAYQPVYQQPSQSNYGGLASSIAGGFGSSGSSGTSGASSYASTPDVLA